METLIKISSDRELNKSRTYLPIKRNYLSLGAEIFRLISLRDNPLSETKKKTQ